MANECRPGPASLPYDRGCVECYYFWSGSDGDRHIENVAGGPDPDHQLHVDRFDDHVGPETVSSGIGCLDSWHDEIGVGGLAVSSRPMENPAPPCLFSVAGQFGYFFCGGGF